MSSIRYSAAKYLRKVFDNCGKALNHGSSRGKYFYYQRNGKEQIAYYLTKLQGNYIKSYKIQFFHEAEAINLYISFSIPTLLKKEVFIPDRKMELLVKTKIKDYKQHLKLFIELTPDLEWDY